MIFFPVMTWGDWKMSWQLQLKFSKTFLPSFHLSFSHPCKHSPPVFYSQSYTWIAPILLMFKNKTKIWLACSSLQHLLWLLFAIFFCPGHLRSKRNFWKAPCEPNSDCKWPSTSLKLYQWRYPTPTGAPACYDHERLAFLLTCGRGLFFICQKGGEVFEYFYWGLQ